MRIAYISLHWPRQKTSSIGKKISAQTQQWRKLGHTTQFFSHMHSVEDNGSLIHGKYFTYEIDNQTLKTEFGRINAIKKLISAVKTFTPDVIYLRWGMYVHPAKQILDIAPTVVEINTNDIEEHGLLNWGLSLYNRLTRSIFLGKSRAHVFMTGELAINPIFSKFNRPYRVIANGIDLIKTPFYEAPNNQQPRLIFIGTPGMPWHGVDKLINFGENNSDIQISIVGISRDSILKNVPENVKFHGYKTGQDFEDLLKSADAAIGSMSLHVNHMNEAAPLKIRDCVARGIPRILPYKDTDLHDLNCSEILNIPNNPHNLMTNNEIIREFIFAMRGKRIARDVVYNRLDLSIKEKARIEFFQSILD